LALVGHAAYGLDLSQVAQSHVYEVNTATRVVDEDTTSDKNDKAATVWLDWHKQIDLDDFDSKYGSKGKGTTVVVIEDDTIDGSHSWIGSTRLLKSLKITGDVDGNVNVSTSVSKGNHATHMASSIGSKSRASRGVAPETNFVSLQVSTKLDCIAALKWVHNNRNNVAFKNSPIVAINLSFGFYYDSDFSANSKSGFDAYTVYGTPAQDLAGDRITIVASAGNFYQDRGVLAETNYGSFLGLTFKNYLSNEEGMYWPATDEKTALRVGAVATVNKKNQAWGEKMSYAASKALDRDRIMPFSNRSVTLKMLLAPGHSIDGAVLNSGHQKYDGTSDAAAITSGAVALLQSYAITKIKRYLTVTEVKNALLNTGPRLEDSAAGSEAVGLRENDNVANSGHQWRRLSLIKAVDILPKN